MYFRPTEDNASPVVGKLLTTVKTDSYVTDGALTLLFIELINQKAVKQVHKRRQETRINVVIILKATMPKVGVVKTSVPLPTTSTMQNVKSINQIKIVITKTQKTQCLQLQASNVIIH